MNAGRVVYLVDEDGPVPRFGFAYGTLPGHAESGEERFLVEWDRIESHQAFNKSEAHPEVSKLFGPYAAGGRMEHFEIS